MQLDWIHSPLNVFVHTILFFKLAYPLFPVTGKQEKGNIFVTNCMVISNWKHNCSSLISSPNYSSLLKYFLIVTQTLYNHCTYSRALICQKLSLDFCSGLRAVEWKHSLMLRKLYCGSIIFTLIFWKMRWGGIDFTSLHVFQRINKNANQKKFWWLSHNYLKLKYCCRN